MRSVIYVEIDGIRYAFGPITGMGPLTRWEKRFQLALPTASITPLVLEPIKHAALILGTEL